MAGPINMHLHLGPVSFPVLWGLGLGHLLGGLKIKWPVPGGKILGAVLHGWKHSLDQAAASLRADWVVLAGIAILWSLNEIHMAPFNVNSAKSWLGNK